MNLPLVVSVVLFTIISGAGTTAIGYYGPFMLLSTILASIGAGLLTTFEVTTAHPAWIGFQVLYGNWIGHATHLHHCASRHTSHRHPDRNRFDDVFTDARRSTLRLRRAECLLQPAYAEPNAGCS